MRKPNLKSTSRGVLYADPKDILRCNNAKIQIKCLLRLAGKNLNIDIAKLNRKIN